MADNSAAQRVAAEVRAELARQRKSQRDVMTVLGLSQPAVARRLRGEVAFDVGEVERVAALLGVPPSRLLAAADGPPVSDVTPAGAA